jgi:WD40 repeat protein
MLRLPLLLTLLALGVQVSACLDHRFLNTSNTFPYRTSTGHALVTLAEPAGQLLVPKTEITIRQLPGGALRHVFAIPPSRRIAVSPDGRYLVAFREGGSAQLYQLPDGRWLHTFPRPGPHGSYGAAAFDANSQILALAGVDELHIWSLTEQRRLHTIAEPDLGNTVSMSADGRRVAATAWEKRITVWDTASGAVLFRLRVDADLRNRILALSPDGGLLAIGGDVQPRNQLPQAGYVDIWDLTGAQASFQQQIRRPELINALAFDPSGRYLALAGLFARSAGLSGVIGWEPGAMSIVNPDILPYRRIWIWGLREQHIVQTIWTPQSVIHGLQFGADGRTLVAVGKGFSIWQVRPWEWLLWWAIPVSAVAMAAYHLRIDRWWRRRRDAPPPAEPMPSSTDGG